MYNIRLDTKAVKKLEVNGISKIFTGVYNLHETVVGRCYLKIIDKT